MGAQPLTLQPALVIAGPSTDTLAPTSTIASPTAGTALPAGVTVSISGTAFDSGGIVSAVDVSVDGGITWRRATGKASWTYSWTPETLGAATIRSRAIDDSANIQAPGTQVNVTVGPRTCPCSIWTPSATPEVASNPDALAVELGVRFRSDIAGFITGMRFYKGVGNTGTHLGKLWTANGTLLGSVTFTNETASGWQETNFSSPVAIAASTVYVASYHTSTGHYSSTGEYFAATGKDSTPLHALQNGVNGNGLYVYGPSAFPTLTYNSANYWVDVVFQASGTPDTSAALSIADVTVTEGNSGTLNAALVVTLSQASAQTVTVNYATANGTAVAPGDYTARTGSLSFAPGTTTAQVTVPVVGDTRNEIKETLTVKLSGATNAALADSTGLVTIVDNDPVPSLTIADVTRAEGNSGSANAVFTVTLNAVSGRPVSVNYATANVTATGGADYTTTTGTLSFAPGVTTRQITVPVRGDILDEANETFQVNLSGAVAATFTDSRGIGTIADDDLLPTVSISNVTVTEGTGANRTATFTVRLSTPSGRTLSVGYVTANGTATSPGDYTAASGTLSFAAGVVSRTVTVTIIGDAAVEPSETFLVNLRNPSNVSIADAQGVCTILNND